MREKMGNGGFYWCGAEEEGNVRWEREGRRVFWMRFWDKDFDRWRLRC